MINPLLEHWNLRREYEKIPDQTKMKEDKNNYIVFLENLVIQYRKQLSEKN